MKTVLWQRKSRYALVTLLNNDDGAVIEKEISPENVNSGNSGWVNSTSVYFRQKLRTLGVLLAEPYTFEEIEGRAIQRSPYVGPDLDEVFGKDLATPEILRGLLSTIRGVLEQKKREVGIDARLSNFCLGDDKRVYYVDTFPPLCRYNGEFIVHFPNPTDPEVVEQELKRKFDALGIIRRLRFSILAQDAGINEQHILVAINEVMGKDFGQRVQKFFQGLPDNLEPGVALSRMTLSDPDAIRELALRFMPPKGESRDKYFSEVFDLSSNFCPLKITPAERLSRLHTLFA